MKDIEEIKQTLKTSPKNKFSFKNICKSTKDCLKNFGYNQIQDLLHGRTKKSLVLRFFSILIGLFSLLLTIILIPTVYFMVLLYAEPRSIPAINKYIEQKLNEGSGITFSMDDMKISLNNELKILIKGKNVKITVPNNNFNFPEVGIQFKIRHLIRGNFRAYAVIIPNPHFTVTLNENGRNVKAIDTNPVERIYTIIENVSSTKKAPEKLIFENLVIDILSPLKNGEYKKTILVSPQTSFRVDSGLATIDFGIQTSFFLEGKHNPVNLTTDCKMPWSKKLSCNIGFSNLEPKQYVLFTPKNSQVFDYLNNINAIFNGNARVSIDSDYEISDVKFNMRSTQGDFFYKNFFPRKVEFENLIVTGEAKNNFNNITLEEVKAKFYKETDYWMSLDLKTNRRHKDDELVMKFRASNLSLQNLKILWPLPLNKNNIRDWTVERLQAGYFPEAHADIYRKKDNKLNKFKTYKVDSKVKFRNATLEYNPKFPTPTKLNGIAHFSEKDMKVDIPSGQILSSQISNAEVGIKDFKVKPSIFYGKSNLKGPSNDLYNHIKYRNTLDNILSYYVEGNATTTGYIELPIVKGVKLHQTKLDIETNIQNINTKYLNRNSQIKASIQKDIDSHRIDIESDLSNTTMTYPGTDFYKPRTKDGKLTLNIQLPKTKKDLFRYKDIEFNANNNSFKGNAIMNNAGNKLLSFKIDELKYGKNDLTMHFLNKSWIKNNEKNLDALYIKGKNFDVISFVKNKNKMLKGLDANLKQNPKPRLEDYKINININKGNLDNGYFFSDIKGNLICEPDFCNTGDVIATIPENNSKIMLRLNKKEENKKYKISRFRTSFNDIGVMSKMLGVTDLIKGGETDIKGLIYKVKGMDSKRIKGELEIDSNFLIVNNNTLTRVVIDKLAADSSFKSVKKLLKEDNYLSFKSANAEFDIRDSQLEIEKLITTATRMGLGITASGDINLANGKTKIEGFAVPAQKINSLLGLGNVPIVGGVLGGGGGVFAARFTYNRKDYRDDGIFQLHKRTAIAPGPLKNLFTIGN